MRFFRFIFWWGKPLAITPPAGPLLLSELKSQLAGALTVTPGGPMEPFSPPEAASPLDMTLAGFKRQLGRALTVTPGDAIGPFSSPKPAMALDMTLAGVRLALKGQLTEN